MSRTYRRKNYEPVWLCNDPEFVENIWKHTIPQHRAYYHSDSWTDFGARKCGKRMWAKMRRQYDRQELHRCCIEEYEPIFFTTKLDKWLWS